ncbi:MAG: membrane protein insertion efficiency factor YidD [Cellulosilyticaceae bacterium]
MKNILKKIALLMIKAYQVSISPLMGKKCRFVPTCSQYTYEAIETHGFWRGSLLGIRRILKCHPLHPVMYDPVPPKKNQVSKDK